MARWLKHTSDLISHDILIVVLAQKGYEIQYFKAVAFFGRKCYSELLLKVFISLLRLDTFVFMVTEEHSFHTVLPELYTFTPNI